MLISKILYINTSISKILAAVLGWFRNLGYPPLPHYEFMIF